MNDPLSGVKLSLSQTFGYKLCRFIAKMFKVNCKFLFGYDLECQEKL
jgi:hypothetical protein